MFFPHAQLITSYTIIKFICEADSVWIFIPFTNEQKSEFPPPTKPKGNPLITTDMTNIYEIFITDFQRLK